MTAEQVKKAIDDRAQVSAALVAKYERFKASEAGVPIFSRKVPSTAKINNRLNNDFLSDIVDTKTGYLVGNPIFVKYTSRNGGDEEKAARLIITEFTRRNNLPDVDAETVKMASICGWSARLLYVDVDDDASVRVMNVAPWTVIPFFNRTGDAVIEALRYWTKEEKRLNDAGKEEKVIVTYCEQYTPEKILYWKREGADTDFFPDNTARPDGKAEVENLFAPVVPVIVVKNNEELLGDCDKVLSLIDAYDRALSDYSSEIEQFRLAYLMIKGATITDEERDKMQQTGAFTIPEGATVEWLVKQFNDSPIGTLLNKLEKNIVRFAKSVDFTDSNFYGNLTRMAIAFKLWNIETKARTLELKLGTAFRQMWKAVFIAEKKKSGGNELDPLNLEFIFTRNIPVNTMEEAQEQRNLVGIVSDRSRLGRLSWIVNPDDEIERMKKERDEKLMEGDYTLGESSGEGEEQGEGGTGDEEGNEEV